MAAPAVHPTTRRLYDGIGGGLTSGDEATCWQLLGFLDAFLAGQGLAQVDDIVRDSDTHVGWEAQMDPTLADNAALPWLGQFVGVRLDQVTLEAERRARILAREGF